MISLCYYALYVLLCSVCVIMHCICYYAQYMCYYSQCMCYYELIMQFIPSCSFEEASFHTRVEQNRGWNGELPYQVSFQDTKNGYNFHFCGGSVYSENMIICAGHCVAEEDLDNPQHLQVSLSNIDLSIFKIFVHGQLISLFCESFTLLGYRSGQVRLG